MKQSPQLQKAQSAMRPGVITRDGFLGSDTRNLIDILIEDGAEVQRFNLTHADIAHRMIEIRDSGMKGLGDFIDVEPHFEVRVDSVRGKLPCPFGDPGIFPKTNTIARNLELGKEITYTDLNIHMIMAHGFYEGRGSGFRLEPSDIIEVLEIKPAD